MQTAEGKTDRPLRGLFVAGSGTDVGKTVVTAALLRALLQTLQQGTRLAVSHGLTLDGGATRSATVRDWRADAQAHAFAGDAPAIFAIGA